MPSSRYREGIPAVSSLLLGMRQPIVTSRLEIVEDDCIASSWRELPRTIYSGFGARIRSGFNARKAMMAATTLNPDAVMNTALQLPVAAGHHHPIGDREAKRERDPYVCWTVHARFSASLPANM